MMRQVILFASVLLLAGWQLTTAETFSRDKDGAFIGERMEIVQDMGAGEVLTINSATSLSGQLIITTGADRCEMKYVKRMKASDRQQALDFAQVITIEMERTGAGNIISFRAPTNAPWSGTANGGQIEAEIRLPDSCSLEINTAYFDIEAYGPFADLVVSESLSRVVAEDVYHSTEAKVTSRPLILRKIRGSLFISNEYGKIELEDIDTGDKLGTIRNDHAEIEIAVFRGSIDLGNSYERIIARNIVLMGSRNRVRNTSGPIILDFDSLTTGRLRINNNYGRTTVNFLGPVEARFICKNGSNSKIVADGLIMEPTLIEEGRLEFSCGEGEAEIRIYTRGEGDIFLNGPKEVKAEVRP